MKKFLLAGILMFLAACQSTPNLEDDTRYVKLAKVVDVHEFTEAERKEAKLQRPSNSGVSVGMGVSFGSSGSGFMLGAGSMLGSGRDNRKEPPQIAYGANRFTVQPMNSGERLEVMSYEKYKVGDCVKVLSGHPTEFSRLFDLKSGEHCE